MYILEEDDVYKGSIVPIYMNNELEGYAVLIKADGRKQSFMEQGGDEEDSSLVYVRQRWLIEWAAVDDIKETMDKGTFWNQRMLSGKRTHRNISWVGALSWEEYSYIHGGLKEKKYYERGTDRPLDDSNLLF